MEQFEWWNLEEPEEKSEQFEDSDIQRAYYNMDMALYSIEKFKERQRKKRYKFYISHYRLNLIHLYTMLWLILLLSFPDKIDKFSWEGTLYLTLSEELYPPRAKLRNIKNPILATYNDRARKLVYRDLEGGKRMMNVLLDSLLEKPFFRDSLLNHRPVIYITTSKVLFTTDPIFDLLVREYGMRLYHEPFYRKLFRRNMVAVDLLNELLKECDVNLTVEDLLRLAEKERYTVLKQEFKTFPFVLGDEHSQSPI